MNNGARGIALGEIAAMLGCAPPPDADLRISGVASLTEAGPNHISFLSSEAFLKEFNSTAAGAVLVQKNIHPTESPRTVVLTVSDADLAMARLLEAFAPPAVRPPVGADPKAVIDPTAKIAEDVSIGAFSVIGAGVQIGRGTIIHPQVYIGQDVVIGDDCRIYPNVTIRERIRIGSRVTINSGSVLGTDGFGYRWDGTKQAKIPQIGNVIIEDDVEIGSCVCIDRAKFSVTQIGKGTKIDNLVQIGHNVVIGPHCIIAGQAGLAGSAVLGTRVSLGGQSALRDHTRIGDGAMVAACAAVANDVQAKEIVSGMPAIPHRQSLRENAAQRRLPDLVVKIRKLEDEVEQLKARLGQSSDPEKK